MESFKADDGGIKMTFEDFQKQLREIGLSATYDDQATKLYYDTENTSAYLGKISNQSTGEFQMNRVWVQTFSLYDMQLLMELILKFAKTPTDMRVASYRVILCNDGVYAYAYVKHSSKPKFRLERVVSSALNMADNKDKYWFDKSELDQLFTYLRKVDPKGISCKVAKFAVAEDQK